MTDVCGGRCEDDVSVEAGGGAGVGGLRLLDFTGVLGMTLAGRRARFVPYLQISDDENRMDTSHLVPGVMATPA